LRTVIGVMGGAVAAEDVTASAYEIGRLIAGRGWVLLNGGRNAGVMASSARGARDAGGLVIGVLPGESTAGCSADLDVAIVTGMGDARNVINVLSSQVVVALPGGPGTLSEIALALKNGRHVVSVGFPLGAQFRTYYERGLLHDAHSPAEAIELVTTALGTGAR